MKEQLEFEKKDQVVYRWYSLLPNPERWVPSGWASESEEQANMKRLSERFDAAGMNNHPLKLVREVQTFTDVDKVVHPHDLKPDYEIVTSHDADTFLEEIDKLLCDDFLPHGGVSTCPDSDGDLTFTQALVRDNARSS